MILLLLPAARSEVLDRIAISFGKQVITETQVLEEIRVTAFLNQEPLKVDSEDKRKAADRLLEQTLMRRDMEITHYPLPELSDADGPLKEIRARYSTEDAFQEALRRYGITTAELKQHLWWQLTLLRFIDFRFRPAVQVSDAEIRTYYAKKRAEWEHQGVAKIPTIEDSRTDIEKILTDQLVDQAVDRWLGDARTRLNISYHEEAFQ